MSQTCYQKIVIFVPFTSFVVYFVPLFFQVKKKHGCISFQTLPFPASPGEEFPLGRRPIIALDRGLTYGLWDFHQLQLRAIHQRVAHRPKGGPLGWAKNVPKMVRVKYRFGGWLVDHETQGTWCGCNNFFLGGRRGIAVTHIVFACPLFDWYMFLSNWLW